MTCAQLVFALCAWGVGCAPDRDDLLTDTVADLTEDRLSDGRDAPDFGGDVDAPTDDASDVDMSAEDAADVVPDPDAVDVGEVGEEASCDDEDGDGRGSGCAAGLDCDDGDPDNWVSCASCIDGDRDGVRAGCDRYVAVTGPDCDDGDGFVFRESVTYIDRDFDTYGDDGISAAVACVAEALPVGMAGAGGDCNDVTAAISPGSVELPEDGFDNDCASDGDGVVSDGEGVFVVDAAYCLEGGAEGGRGCPFTDLQIAADAAAAMGGVVFIAEGTYGAVVTEVSLFGAFRVGPVGSAPPTWSRAADADTRIELTSADAVGIRVAGEALLHDVEVVGSASPGVIAIESTSDLTLVNVDVSVLSPAGDAVGIEADGGVLRVLGGTIEVGAAGDAVGIRHVGSAVLIDRTELTVTSDVAVTALDLSASGPIAVRELDAACTGASATGLSIESGTALLVEDSHIEVAAVTGQAVGAIVQSEVDAAQQLRGNTLIAGGPSAVGLRDLGAGLLELRHNQILARGVEFDAVGVSSTGAARIRVLNNVIFTGAVTEQLLLESSGPTEIAANNFRLQGDVSGRAEVFRLTGEWAVVANTIADVDDGSGEAPRVFGPIEAAQSLVILSSIFDVRADAELMPGVADVAALNECIWDGCTAARGNMRRDARLALDGLDIEDHGPAVDTGMDLTTLAIGVSDAAPLLDIRGGPRPLDGHDPEGDGSADDLAEWDIGARELAPH